MARLYVALGLAALVAGCWGGAEDPGPPPPVIPDDFERGMDRYDRKQYQEAIDAFTRAIKDRPDWAPSYTMRGNAFQHIIDTGEARWTEKQYLDAAVADYSKAIQLAPSRPEPWYHRAVAYIGLRKYDLAARDLTQLTENISPNSADPHRLLGYLYEEKFEGMDVQALQHYQAYVRNGGDDPLIRERVGVLQGGPTPAPTEDRERRAKELFGEFGDATWAGDKARMIAALEEMLATYGETEFVKSKKDFLQQQLDELKKQP